METIERAAQRLIQEHGEDAAGEAFLQALEARVDGSDDLSAYWVEVAVEIIHVERVGPAMATSGAPHRSA
jgi:hypothetical protein